VKWKVESYLEIAEQVRNDKNWIASGFALAMTKKLSTINFQLST
jgi:hypothetical protein